MKKLVYIMLGMLIVLSMMVSAVTITIDKPVANDLIRDSTVFSATLGAADGAINITNVTWEYSVDGGAYTSIPGGMNSTQGDVNVNLNTTVNITLTTATLSDNTVLTFRATAYNRTYGNATEYSPVASGTQVVYIDNGVPLCLITNPSSSQSITGNTLSFQGDALNATECVISVTGSSTKQDFTGTISGGLGSEICTYTFNQANLGDGTYTFTLMNADYGASGARGNETTCTATNVKIERSSGGGSASLGSIAKVSPSLLTSVTGESIPQKQSILSKIGDIIKNFFALFTGN